MGISISTIGQTIDNNARLKTIQAQLFELQTQLTSGKKARDYAGLGIEAIGSQRARDSLSHIDTYLNNIDIGTTRVKQMDQSIAEFRDQAKNAIQFMATERQKGEVDLTQINEFADSTLDYVRSLLNTRDGDRYLFSGADAFNPPMNDTGAHGTYMTSLFDQWQAGTITTDQLLSSATTTPDTTMGYSASLSSGLTRGVFVRADVDTDVNYTIYGNDQAIKDVLNVLALTKAIDLDKVATDPGDPPGTKTAPGSTNQEQKDNFFELYEALIKKAEDAFGELDKQQQNMQRVELRLRDIGDGHKADKATLEDTLAQIEDADTTDVAVKINSLQVQLSAAYQVTARLGQLSLTQFL